MLTPSRSNSHSDSSREDKLSSAVTVEYGIQVDFRPNPQNAENCLLCDEDEESLQLRGLTPAERRKMKKKINKKRRKQKAEEMQRRQARRRIGNIIQEFYQGRARFEDYQEEIQQQVRQIMRSDFRDYLDQLIRMRVNVKSGKCRKRQYIQKSIWEYTQSILYDNSFQRNEDNLFYGQMVEQIYQRYLQMQESSRQIEKVINIYLRQVYSQDSSDPEATYNYNNLAINTFNYMIQTDQTLKNLLHLCDRKVPLHKHLQRQKLETLISIIDNYHTQDCFDQDQDEDDSSTSCTQPELQHDIGERRRHHRKKKVKSRELSTEEEDVIMRMEQFTLKEYRGPCRVEQEVLQRWSKEAMKYRLQK